MPSLVDTKIATCSSWDDFVELTNSQKTSKDKGDLFERLTQVYLTVTPSYQSKVKHVWLLGNDELPEAIRKRLNLPSRDEGIDLLCETYNGEYWSVQCKYKSDQKRPLNHKELATFTSVSFNTSNSISLGLVVHTSTKKVKKSELMPNVTEIGLERWLSLSDEEWKRIVDFCKSNRLKPPRKRKPRAHQKQAIKDSAEHFVIRKHKRGKLIMPCGTGKSLTAFWIAQEFKSKSIIVAVPSLALIKQSLEDWTAEFLADDIKPEWLVICSDESVGATGDADSTVASVYETGIPTNPSDAELDAFLKKKAKVPKIIFTTYQSAEKLTEAASRVSVSFDLLIADEAHKTVGRKDKSFAALLFEENIKIKKRLFMTATERVYNAAKDDVISMDDETVYGTTCHQLSFKKAIDAKIICDYKIVTISVSESEIQTLIENQEKLLVKSGNTKFDTDAQSLAAGLAVNKAFKKYGIKHALTFHSSIKRARDFCEQQDNLPSTIDVVNSHISSKNSAGERARLLKAFAEEDYSLISNARCLTEGVDIKAIDCVTFVDPKKSTVDIVQAAGRAMRQSKETNKECGYIILPLIIKDGESLEDIKSSDRFSDIAKIITSLATQDERIIEELSVTTEQKLNKPKNILIDEELAMLINFDLTELDNVLKTKIWERVGRANWLPFKDARDYVRRLNLSSQKDWKQYLKNDYLPPNIPRSPNLVYANRGWKGLGDWIGTFKVRDKEFLPFEEARDFVRSLRLKNHSEWKKYIQSPNRNPLLPSQPDKVYAEEGWLGIRDWLGTGSWNDFIPFEDARNFARSLNLTGSTGWNKYVKRADFPDYIPKSPQAVYSDKGWQGFADWLGSNRLRQGEVYWDYLTARNYVRKLGLKNAQEWLQYSKSQNKPRFIPAAPANVYKDTGWIGVADFIGKKNIAKGYKEFLPFSDAKVYVHKIKLSSSKEWRKFSKSKDFPPFLPKSPEKTYKHQGWSGFGDWLGTGNITPGSINYVSFNEAKKFARSLNLKSHTEWQKYSSSGKRPQNIPAAPERIYKNSGWNGYADWLGTNNKHHTEYKWADFSEARKFARTLNLKNENEWRKFAKSDKRPSNIPYSPDSVYKKFGWNGYKDFLGYEIVRTKQWRPFKEARTFVRTLNLKSFNEWRSWASSGQRPDDIPNAPEIHYKGKGWAGHPDWMGYENKKK